MRTPNGIETQENCLTCKWRESRTFCNVSGTALQRLQDSARMEVHRTGAILFAEGQAAEGVFILCNGRAKISTASERGNVIILKVAPAGEVLAGEAVLANRRHEETAELLDSCQVKFIPKKEFVQHISQHMQMAFKTVVQLANNCGAARDQVRMLGSSISGRRKLAQLLINWTRQANRRGAPENAFPVPFSHEEIAQMIGSSRETVTRALNHLKRNKVIDIRTGVFTVRDIERLRTLATG